MIIKFERLEIVSKKEFEMIDITPKVDELVARSGVREGVLMATTGHTTSSLLITEGAECLERDVPEHLERLAPKNPPDGTYGWYHNRYLDFDGRLGYNAGDHLKSVLGGVQCFFPIDKGKAVRGSRQRIYFVEYDGPLARTLFLQVIGQ